MTNVLMLVTHVIQTQLAATFQGHTHAHAQVALLAMATTAQTLTNANRVMRTVIAMQHAQIQLAHTFALVLVVSPEMAKSIVLMMPFVSHWVVAMVMRVALTIEVVILAVVMQATLEMGLFVQI